MSHPLLEKHRATLDGALNAIATRGYWSAYPEMPSPKLYGETAAEEGKQAFNALLGQRFVLDQPGQTGWHGGEASPYGIELGVSYPVCDPDALIAGGLMAMAGWPAAAASPTASSMRVVPSAPGQERLSIAFFLGAQLDAVVPVYPLPEALAREARGPATDPHNPLLRDVGWNYLKGRLRSHPDVAERYYQDVFRERAEQLIV